ncbi:CYP2D6 [Branchiostoma lanceolatum]|uniref:CYP2D6 protein n=1 Tax=Branchiostoma lanceolatum TaxID=7740 RepID=A0A8K0EWS5_BRALA|nr:CYP2D6 [Branchiostoma lanceolatum]
MLLQSTPGSYEEDTVMSIMSALLPAVTWLWSLQALLVSVVLIITTVLWRRSSTAGLPPGPRGLPLVGNLFSLNKDMPLVYQERSKKFGDVFTYYVLGKPWIILNGFSAIREALVANADVFSSRPAQPLAFLPDQSARGLLHEPYTPRFKELKKFTMSALRDFGVGKKSMEGKILEEAQALSDRKLRKHIREEIAKHKETFDPNDIRDYMDAFLLEAKKREGDENSTFTEEQHVEMVRQLFLAGTDTTATTLHWAVLFMILHPDIQQKVQQEIDSVLGPNQVPSMEHRSQMPYTEATLSEITRMAATAPLAPFHSTSSDVFFRGYRIPEATAVVVNIWSVLYDPQLWPEPYKFDPTRFLDDSGKFTRREEIIMFSMGRRLCPGERLAKAELFLIFSLLLQRFTFKPPEGSPVPSAKGVFGFVRSPAPFQLVAEPRN